MKYSATLYNPSDILERALGIMQKKGIVIHSGDNITFENPKKLMDDAYSALDSTHEDPYEQYRSYNILKSAVENAVPV